MTEKKNTTKSNPTKKVSKEKAVKAKTEQIKTTVENAKPTKQSLVQSKRFRISALIVLAIALITSLLYLYKSWFIAAMVNGQPITRIEIIRELEKQGGAQVMDSIVTKTLIQQEAAKQNIQVADEELNKEIDEFKASLESSGQSFEQLLQAQGVSMEQVKEDFRLRIVLRKILADKTDVTDEDVNSYIETNKENFGEETDTTTEEFRSNIKSSLESQKFNTEVQSLLTELKDKANINYWVQY